MGHCAKKAPHTDNITRHHSGYIHELKKALKASMVIAAGETGGEQT